MIDPAILRALAAAGATAEMIVAAVAADHQQEQDKLADKRAKAAARQRKSRAASRDVTNGHAMSHENGVTDADPSPPSSPPSSFSPTPPHITTPSPSPTPATSLRSVGRARASRLPVDWTPTIEDIAFARKHLPEPRISTEVENFRDYWHARAGPGAVKQDWVATWRTWCRKAALDSGTPQNGQRSHSPKQSAGADFFAGIAEVARDIDRDNPMAGEPDDAIPLGRVNIDG